MFPHPSPSHLFSSFIPPPPRLSFSFLRQASSLYPPALPPRHPRPHLTMAFKNSCSLDLLPTYWPPRGSSSFSCFPPAHINGPQGDRTQCSHLCFRLSSFFLAPMVIPPSCLNVSYPELRWRSSTPTSPRTSDLHIRLPISPLGCLVGISISPASSISLQTCSFPKPSSSSKQ